MDALHSLRVDKTAITVSPLSAPPWTIESIGFPGRLTSACKPSSLYDNSTMATVNLPPDFKEFLKLLNAHQVEYLLIGGYAVAYHGYPRATADMDIWIATHPQNTRKIVIVLKEFGFDLPGLTAELFQKKDQIIRMGVPPVRIEIATSISGVTFAECYASRVVDVLDEVEVNLIDLAHLKINKKAAGRHKDLDDLENLP